MAVDKDMTFCFFAGVGDDNIPMVLIGIPKKAYDDLLANPMIAKDADLTKAGLPVRFSVFACETHDAGRKQIEGMMRAAGITVDDRQREDFSILGNKP